ncbi:hypothetical protein [Streptomyces sp. Je 1-332]|uniref:hypothetical protein n=1 Tax=Streptomyces sp. Je 1-332 TaxID=3231270 RepID=UPI003459E6E1
MVFGKGGARDEAPVAAVPWVGVREFTVGTVERPAASKGGRPVRGPRAIRVPAGGGKPRVFAPCAYIAPAAPPVPASAMEPCLFEDPEAQRLLCYLVPDDDESGDGGERCFRVFDGQHDAIGTIRRIPPSSKLFKHTWRINQPGHSEIIGRNQWVSGDAKQIAERGAGKAFTEVLSAVSSMGHEGSDQGSPIRKSRKLEWRSGGELVMISESIKLLAVKANWLDRRLAFAFAVLGDS